MTEGVASSLVSVQEDGHAVLLLEIVPGQRTFSDYPNLYVCLETIVNMYEEYREASDQHQDGDLKDFMRWIDDFYRVELLTYVSELGRYQHTPRDGLKRLFEEKDNGQYQPAQNGTTNTNQATGGSSLNSCSIGDEHFREESDDDDDDDPENWDD